MPGLMIQPKKTASLIIAGMKPPMGEEYENEVSEEKDYEVGLEAAAEDMLHAIKANDVKLFVQAQKDFHELYDQMNEEEETEPEYGSESEMEGGK